MKVLHIIDEPYDSGITQYALKAAAGLAGRGHDCHVWGLEGCYPLREAERQGLPGRGYTHPWLNLPALRRMLREERFELVVSHTGSGHTLAVALAAWHGTRLPVIRTRGDARPLKPRPGRRFLWRRTAGFIAANKRILSEFGRLYGGMELPTAAIFEGCDDPGPRQPPQRGAPTVGIVSRLDPVKGHSYFLRAAVKVIRRHPETRFMVVGRQENVKSADLAREAHNLGIGDHVDLTGHVPDAFDYMRRCHIGVVASVGSEAVSRAAVEWMASGRPLVATEVGCLPEYVLDKKTGYLVAPRDPDVMARAVNRLVRDVFLREKLGLAARRRYEELFTLGRFLDETERFYAETIQTVPSR